MIKCNWKYGDGRCRFWRGGAECAIDFPRDCEHRAEEAAPTVTCPKCRKELLREGFDWGVWYCTQECGWTQPDPRQRPPFPAPVKGWRITECRDVQKGEWFCYTEEPWTPVRREPGVRPTPDEYDGLRWIAVREPQVRCFEWIGPYAMTRFKYVAIESNGGGKGYKLDGSEHVLEQAWTWDFCCEGFAATHWHRLPESELPAKVAALKAKAQEGKWPKYVLWESERLRKYVFQYASEDSRGIGLNTEDSDWDMRNWISAGAREITEQEALALVAQAAPAEGPSVEWTYVIPIGMSNRTLEGMTDGTLRWKREGGRE